MVKPIGLVLGAHANHMHRVVLDRLAWINLLRLHDIRVVVEDDGWMTFLVAGGAASQIGVDNTAATVGRRGWHCSFVLKVKRRFFRWLIEGRRWCRARNKEIERFARERTLARFIASFCA